jgi:transcriptional regulator of acetoin/glycerol metabolism
MFVPYSDQVEQAMRFTFNSLNERQRRLFLATESLKLGRGGISYLSRLLDCDRKTIYRGLQELNQPALPVTQTRKKGVADDAA